MTFAEWASRTIGPEYLSPVYVSLVTEGLSPNKHRLLAIVTGEDDGDAMSLEARGFGGGEPERTEAFTGFGTADYRECVMSPMDYTHVPGLFAGRVVVGYTMDRFTLPFLNTVVEQTIEHPLSECLAVLDVQSLVNIAGQLTGFEEGMSPAFTRTYKAAGSLDNLFAASPAGEVCGDFVDGLPAWKSRIYKTRALYKELCSL